MNGAGILDTFCGTSSVLGLMDKNPDDTIFRATALGWLRLVVKNIQQRQKSWHWRFLEKTATAPTATGQHSYDLPTDIDTNKLFAIYERTNNITLTYKPYDEFVRLVANPSASSGTSLIWTFFAKTLRLYPVPASIITMYLDYIKLITSPSDDATALDIPDKYEPVVIDGMLVYGYKFDPEMGDVLKQQAIFEDSILRMEADNRTMINEYTETGSHRDRLTHGVEMFPLND
jgi:hypothetical protein